VNREKSLNALDLILVTTGQYKEMGQRTVRRRLAERNGLFGKVGITEFSIPLNADKSHFNFNVE
jgi:hypothetical protein